MQRALARANTHGMRRDPALALFRLLGVPTRLIVYQRVRRRPQTATMLAKEMSISRTAIVQHLSALKAHGLVFPTRAGGGVVYRAREGGLGSLAAWLDRYG